MTFCLDSWAVLAWLDGDAPAAGRVQAVLPERPVMSWVNAVEVLRAVVELELPGVVRMVETAQLKSRLRIALADCFAIATAAGTDSVLMTGDAEIIDAGGLPCRVEDLRPE